SPPPLSSPSDRRATTGGTSIGAGGQCRISRLYAGVRGGPLGRSPAPDPVTARRRVERSESVVYTSGMALADVFDATVTAVRTDPGRAAVRLRVEGIALDGVATEVRAGRHTLIVDEPPSLGGQGQAANPVQVALAALASCQVVTYRFWATRLGIRV